MKTFVLDIHSPARPVERYWELCVGSCHAATALREDYRAQLRRCSTELGFQYVRFHGLLDDDMSVMVKSRTGNDYILSFTNIDSIFDFLLSIRMKPFVELGFMPECLKSSDDTVFHYKGNISPPNDYTRWEWLIEELIRHLIGRYGRAEVRQWFFEVWNEPNLGGESGVGGFWAASMEEYFKLYRHTASAIKRVDPALRVGGPATSNNALIPEMVAFCRESGTPIDFISTHHYPTDVVLGYGVEDSLNFAELFHKQDPQKEEERQELAQQYEVFRRELWKRVDRGVVTGMTRRAVQEAQGLPVYYTEWNSLAGLPSDGPFGASFIAKTVMDNMGLVKCYSYWTFTDIFEEGGMPSAAFHGGFGLLTLQGIPKAGYRVYQMLHMLGSRMYEAQLNEETLDVYAMYSEEASAVQLLAVNHHSLQHDIKTQPVRLTLTGFEGRIAVHAELYRVDETHTNALRAWQEMGEPEYLSEGERAKLISASALERENLKLPVEDGRVSLELSIPPMGTALVMVYL